ncbi:MarR family winged helix-turn-helix transcriptional regulator [Ponticoccus litoralis]|uniref:MarR family transcriptional regulator n=1 Tax=Ponticoccus litoralis TaxID=422297 RepID=A0AAW9SRH4_9RHOB
MTGPSGGWHERHERAGDLAFSELLTADQLLRSRLTRVLPNRMEISHFSVLNQLARGGEKTPAQLAKSFHVTRGAMTNTLSKLEIAGYVHIRPDWDDARRKLVSISPAGRAARDAALAAITPLIDEMLGDLGEAKVKAALPVLRELRLRLEA